MYINWVYCNTSVNISHNIQNNFMHDCKSMVVINTGLHLNYSFSELSFSQYKTTSHCPPKHFQVCSYFVMLPGFYFFLRLFYILIGDERGNTAITGQFGENNERLAAEWCPRFKV